MKRIATFAMGIAAAGMFAVSALADVDSMVGKWKWQDFVVECQKGGEYGISCKVVSGPKNVGMEMIMSPLKEVKEKGAEYYAGKVKHPGNGKVYNTKMSRPDENSWKLDGCTDDGACATGTFVRVK
jgi:uncharacterized protein (DUF2147 family)